MQAGVNLNNKKILFVAPSFYLYHNMIKNEMEKMGATVFYEPDIKRNIIFKLLNNTSRYLLKISRRQYYKNVFLKYKDVPIDYIFIIYGFLLPTDLIDNIKEKRKNIRIIMYQWDSNKFNPYIQWINHVDKIVTFDYDDSRTYGITYLPLFFANDIRKCRKSIECKIYDFLFVSSYTYERYKKIKSLLPKMDAYRLKSFVVITPLRYIKELCKGRILNLKYLSFKAINRDSYIDLLSKSKCVIDITHSHQSGLPMRIIEAFGAGVDVLTTNGNIMNEKSMLNKIHILDEACKVEDIKFENIIDIEAVEKYSIQNWIIAMFE